MPATKWDSSLIADKCVLLEYSVDPNDVQNQSILRGYRGLSYAAAVTIKTALDAEKTVTAPVIDGVTFSGTWRVGTARIVRTESGPLAGSHEVQQSMKYGLNQVCMSGINERLVRSRSYPIEQNENAWMYYELMQSEKTKKWVGLSYDAALSEYEYLSKVFYTSNMSAADAVPSNPDTVHEYQIIYADVNKTCRSLFYYPGEHIYEYDDDTHPGYDRFDQVYAAGNYYIISHAYANQTIVAYGYYPTITVITNPTFETWYEEESDGSYTMYRTLKETTAKPIKKYRKLQYAGMARVWNLPTVGDSTVTIYGITDTSTVIYAYTKFRIGNDVYRVKSDCSSSTDGGTTIWTVSITPEITEETEDLIDAGESKETQVYFEAL